MIRVMMEDDVDEEPRVTAESVLASTLGDILSRAGLIDRRHEETDESPDIHGEHVAAERTRLVEALRALPTYDHAFSQMGGGMEKRDDEFGDWYSADDVQELLGWDPTEPTL